MQVPCSSLKLHLTELQAPPICVSRPTLRDAEPSGTLPKSNVLSKPKVDQIGCRELSPEHCDPEALDDAEAAAAVEDTTGRRGEERTNAMAGTGMKTRAFRHSSLPAPKQNSDIRWMDELMGE